MKRYTIVVAVALAALWSVGADAVQAQNIDGFRRRLAEPAAVDGARRAAVVTVTESADAAAEVSRHCSRNHDAVRFQGYRVGLYSGNDPQAQENSLAAKETFEEKFPGIRVYWVYDNPYFKVTAGDCLTEEEAVMLLAQVRPYFPKAYVVRAEMTLENIILPESAGKPQNDGEPADTAVVE